MRGQKHCRYGLLATMCVVLFWASRPGMALVISEVMYHPYETGAAAGEDEALEFIELYNDRAVFEDLGGYAFANGIEYVFPPGTTLPAKQYLVVARDPNALEAAYGITGVYGPCTGRLNNDGERIELSNENGEIILSLRYNDTRPWPAAADGTGHSLILAKLGADPAEASTWSASTYIGGTPGGPDQVQVEPEDPTQVTLVDIGHAGRYFKGTTEPSPGAGGQATTAWTEIGFNDNPASTAWAVGASGYGYSNDSGELQYIRTQLNDMSGNYISVYARLAFAVTTEQIASFSELRAEVHYDDGFVLYLNGTRVADSGDMPPGAVPYNQGGGQAWDPPTLNVDLTDYIDLLVPGTNLLAIQAHNAQISGSSDCMASPVLRAVIEAPQTSDDPRSRVLINELLANSDAAPATDWIELYNPGPTTVDLSDVYLSDDRDNLLQYKIPDGTVLQPGEFWVVGEGTGPDGMGFALDFSGETVYVTAATSDAQPKPLRVMDAVRYDVMEPDVTWGRFFDGANAFGALASATPAGPNAGPLARDIVINEIMYHHAMRQEQYEYVELYNRGTETVDLSGWAFTDGIDYTFEDGTVMPPGSYLVVAKDPDFLLALYENLTLGSNLVGPYSGNLDDHSERLRLSYPLDQAGPESYMVTVDEVTYYDGGRWPTWADGQGTSLELIDPRSHNDTPGAWADSDESSKTTWQPFSFTIEGNNSRYRHDSVSVFDMMLLNRGEVLLDDLQLIIDDTGRVPINRLNNSGFEAGPSPWRILGNHVQSFVTTEDRHSGSRALHLIATGHGDPGANRINQSMSSITATTVTFSGWARWIKGSRFLLTRVTRDLSPVQPPRPSYAFELDMPLDLGTPGRQNTAFAANRGPDILDVQHAPVMPAGGEPIVVTARVTDNDGVGTVTLYYRSEGLGAFTSTPMTDSGSGDDVVAGDSLFTGTIPPASGGTMRAFYIQASDGSASTRFPTRLQPSADVPDRTCLVRVGDTVVNSRFATYRVWMSNDVVSTFRSRPNLSNELLDCTFVYNETDVFYNCRIRHRGSPFLRGGSGRSPSPGNTNGFRIDFNPDQAFRDREEINLDGTEGSSRGPLQERASYWFYRKMGLQYSRQEYVRLIMNGTARNIYEHVQKIDGDYIDKWFGENNAGYIHKIDDYFEYNSEGTSHRNLDEGLKHDSSHPLIKETYRWGFEKRSHRQEDDWQHLLDFAVAMNTSSSSPAYEQVIESVIDPCHFAAVLAIRHAVGDWDSYGYNRGKNNYFYYALPEGKWYLLPWDIDFALGSGNGTSTSLFSVNGGQFPEVNQFVNHPTYKTVYLLAFKRLVEGPWQTSYGTADPPTEFDIFLDDAADALSAEGLGGGRRNSIKAFVRDRRNFILNQVGNIQPPEPPRRR